MIIEYPDGVSITVEGADVHHEQQDNEVHVLLDGKVLVIPLYEGTTVTPYE